MLPCAEYILEGPLRILVHLVSDLPKAFVELNDGTACRLKASCLQASHCCLLIFPRNSFCLILSFFRHLLALLICPLASTHNKPPRVYAYLLSEYTKRKRIVFVKKKAPDAVSIAQGAWGSRNPWRTASSGKGLSINSLAASKNLPTKLRRTAASRIRQ